MMARMMVIVWVAVLCCIGCNPSASETPVEAIQSIIELYEARDFDALVRTRYAEISKAESEQQIQSLIERFQTRYQNEIELNQAVSIYKSALGLTPDVSQGGKVATFKLESGFIKLSRMPNGKWGFHL